MSTTPIIRTGNCDICNRDRKCSGCSITPDGLIFCRGGVQGNCLPGLVYLGQARRDPQWALYRQKGDARGLRLVPAPQHHLNRPSQPAPRREPDEDRLDPVEIEQILARARRRSDHRERIAELAADLGVTADSLHALGYVFGPVVPTDVRVWNQKTSTWEPEYRTLAVWACPAVGATGELCGIATRARDGSKKQIHGSQLGLHEPNDWFKQAEAAGVLYLPEGQSGTAALLSMGLAASGRPSNVAGIEVMIARLRPLAERGVRMVIVADRDKNGAGVWGAGVVAEALTDAFGVRIEIVYPPDQAKDSREWLNRQAVDLHDADCLRRLGKRYAATVEIVPPAAPTQEVPEVTEEEIEAAILPPISRTEGSKKSSGAAVKLDAETRNRERCERPRRWLMERIRDGVLSVPTLRCHNLRCPGCRHYRLRKEREHMAQVFAGEYNRGGAIHRIEMPAEKLEALDARLSRRRRKGERAERYAVCQFDGQAIVFTTSAAAAPGSTALTAEQAEAALAEAFSTAAVVGDKRLHFASASHGWAAAKEPREPSHLILGCCKRPPNEVKEICPTPGNVCRLLVGKE